MRTSVRRMSSPSRTTFSSTCSPTFLASLDRVKGSDYGCEASTRTGGLRGGLGRRNLVLADAYVDRLAALGERDLDSVEVARHDRVVEHGPRLVAKLAAAVARRDVDEREHDDLRFGCKLGRGACRRVGGFARTLLLIEGERRLVDQQVGTVRDCARHVRRRGVAGQHDPAAAPSLAE